MVGNLGIRRHQRLQLNKQGAILRAVNQVATLRYKIRMGRVMSLDKDVGHALATSERNTKDLDKILEWKPGVDTRLSTNEQSIDKIQGEYLSLPQMASHFWKAVTGKIPKILLALAVGALVGGWDQISKLLD